MLILCLLLASCSEAEKDVSVITGIEINTTNTRLDQDDGMVDEYDMRVLVWTRPDAGVQVESLSVTTPSGASFSASRTDTGEIDQIDPEYGIEVIRGFESDGDKEVWTLAAIANSDYTLFGDGFYKLTAYFEGGSDSVQIWYGVPGSESSLPFPNNGGFTEPDVKIPMISPVTFEWEPDPNAQKISVYFASESGTLSDDLSPNTRSYGPFEFAPGLWELELAVFVERRGKVKNVDFIVSKGTVYSAEGVVRE